MHQCLHCGLQIGQIDGLPDCHHTEETRAEAASEARWADSYFQENERLKAKLVAYVDLVDCLRDYSTGMSVLSEEKIQARLEALKDVEK